MASPLTLTLVLAVLCAGGTTAQFKENSAPFTFSETSNQYQYYHYLVCPRDQIVFIQYVENGYKQRECQCDKDHFCCQFDYTDCLQDMSPDILQQVTEECWDKSECRPLVTKPRDICKKDGMQFQWPTYSRTLYSCIPGDTVVDLTRQTSASGDVVTVRSLPAGLPHSHTVTCSVQPVGGGQQSVLMGAVRGQGAPPPPCVSVQTRTPSSQVDSFAYQFAFTPDNLSLQQPAHSSLHRAWVWMRVPGFREKIRVTCGPGGTTPSPTPPAGPGTVTVVGLVVAGLVLVVLAFTLKLFFWKRRQRARRAVRGRQTERDGRIVLADLTAARPDVTYEPLRTEGGYQRLGVPGGVGVPSGDVISAGHHSYDDVFGVIDEAPHDVSRVERAGQGVEEAPYDELGPPYVN